jgi:hypothetical protein
VDPDHNDLHAGDKRARAFQLRRPFLAIDKDPPAPYMLRDTAKHG